MAARFVYDGTMSGALIAAALGATFVLSGSNVHCIPYANGMRVIVVGSC